MKEDKKERRSEEQKEQKEQKEQEEQIKVDVAAETKASDSADQPEAERTQPEWMRKYYLLIHIYIIYKFDVQFHFDCGSCVFSSHNFDHITDCFYCFSNLFDLSVYPFPICLNKEAVENISGLNSSHLVYGVYNEIWECTELHRLGGLKRHNTLLLERRTKQTGEILPVKQSRIDSNQQV